MNHHLLMWPELSLVGMLDLIEMWRGCERRPPRRPAFQCLGGLPLAQGSVRAQGAEEQLASFYASTSVGSGLLNIKILCHSRVDDGDEK